MFRQKVDVSDLAIGMYVAELDRPWVGAPFLFQGFVIQEEDELRRLRDHCRFVYVDIKRSEVSIPQREYVPSAPRQEAQVRVIRRGPEPDLTGQADPALYPAQLEKASRLRESAGQWWRARLKMCAWVPASIPRRPATWSPISSTPFPITPMPHCG